MYKLITVEEAVGLLKDGQTLAFNGQVRMSVPEKFMRALVEQYEKAGTPKNLKWLSTTSYPILKIAAGHKGLFKEMTLAHWDQLMAAFGEEINNNDVEAYAPPQGYLAINYDHAASRVPGFLSRMGLHTSLDPRYGCCGLNEISKKHFTTPVEIDGKEYLFYKTLFPDVCVLRGTTADAEGNITIEREAIVTDPIKMAMAAHNNGGIVIVQVERIAPDEHANPHAVKVPGCLVDYIYVDPDQVMMDDYDYNPVFSGEKRLEGEEYEEYLNELFDKTTAKRKPADIFIARRAAQEVGKNYIINLGVGLPSIIPFMAKEMGIADPSVTYTIECGAVGGFPTGCYFGCNVNVSSIIPQADLFRLYEGKGLDMTGVGALEIDKKGNVNVLRKGNKFIGLGGFNHVTGGAKKLIVMSRFMLGSTMENQNGKLVYEDGRASKFCEEVEHISLAADVSLEDGQEVLYITERCVFKLTEEGLTLIEVAPGLDPEKDVIAKMPFRPAVSPELKEMPWECFVN